MRSRSVTSVRSSPFEFAADLSPVSAARPWPAPPRSWLRMHDPAHARDQTEQGERHGEVAVVAVLERPEPGVGPVLDLEDVAGGKICTLAGRVEPRDYADTSAMLDRYADGQLEALADQAAH